MKRLFTCVVVLAVWCVPARAKDDPAQMAKEAQALIAGESVADGVRMYAAALRVAEKRKDLPAQELVTRSLQHALARATMKAERRSGVARTALLVLLEGLDPKLTSAFLCRGQVAHELLLDATRTGEMNHVTAAAQAATAHARLAKAGAFAQAMAAYGAALQHVVAGELQAACAKLEKVLDQAATEGWTRPAVHAATELAAARVRTGDEAGAAAALQKGGDVLKGSGEYALAMDWKGLVTARLAGASKTVLAPYEEALKPHAGGGSASSAGGAGGKGQSAGSRDRSKIGDAWKKLSRSKPFVRVTRSGAGYEIRQAYDRKFEAVQPYAKGLKHHADGGVTLSFWDKGVRLHMIDMTGREGQPGEASSAPPFLFFHRLASGETWGVDKSGRVTIAAR